MNGIVDMGDLGKLIRSAVGKRNIGGEGWGEYNEKLRNEMDILPYGEITNHTRIGDCK